MDGSVVVVGSTVVVEVGGTVVEGVGAGALVDVDVGAREVVEADESSGLQAAITRRTAIGQALFIGPN